MTPTGEPLYLRREPTVDPVLNTWAPDAARERQDVVAYADSALTEVVRRWPWHFTFSKPRRHRRRVTIDGRRFQVVWLSDATAPRKID